MALSIHAANIAGGPLPLDHFSESGGYPIGVRFCRLGNGLGLDDKNAIVIYGRKTTFVGTSAGGNEEIR